MERYATLLALSHMRGIVGVMIERKRTQINSPLRGSCEADYSIFLEFVALLLHMSLLRLAWP
ncbi:MAG: hypothetical protein LC775_07710, partial [Acidobacteria bacterium]|nr:hypothetical protein [Acidobacteriota bacterium]